MSLIVFTAFLTLSSTDTVDSGPSPNWSFAEATSGASSKPHNEIHLESNRLLWNGTEASESHIRSYLKVVKQLNPQPQTILSYGARVPPERIQRVRTLMDGTLNCEPATCLEVTQPQK